MKKAIIFRLGELDRFAVDPRSLLTDKGFDTTDQVVEFNNLADAALKKGNPELIELFAEDSEYICCASRPRAARALLDFADIDYRSRNISWIAVDYDVFALKRAHGTPWYPVIDRDRCTGCGICHDYCLFGTYARDDSSSPNHRISAVNPLNCKVGCPACSRLCKSNALIFPFNPEPGINGALEVVASREESDFIKAFEADPMKVLAERREKRRLLALQEQADSEQADSERERYSRNL